MFPPVTALLAHAAIRWLSVRRGLKNTDYDEKVEDVFLYFIHEVTVSHSSWLANGQSDTAITKIK